MSAISFYLKTPNKKGECSIMLSYLKKGQKFRFSTGLKVKKGAWTGQKVKSQYSGAEEINSLLISFKDSLLEIEREALFLRKDYSLNVIKRKLESKTGKTNSDNDFFKAFEYFITQSKPTRSITTIKAYVGTKNKLQEFTSEKGVEVSFEAINNNFYRAFVDYLIEKNYLNNTIGKHIKVLKTFLNYAKDQELSSANYNIRKFKVFQEDVDLIYLADTELMKIYYLKDLPESLANVRDCFCFACFTGLRFSDLNQLHFSNIREEFIEIRVMKTKDILKIPLNVFAKEILKRHQHGLKPLPNGISNQKTNVALKEIAELAGLDQFVERDNYCGSGRVHFSQPKYELVTTHTARRTFVTLALEKGIRAEVVMAMTGHKSYRTFKKYIKITDKVMQIEMIKLWNKPLMKVV